jgi:Predicted hydrolases of HD superfamily
VANYEYSCILKFIEELEHLKDNTRTAWTKDGRHESIAEHSWRLSVFAMTIEDYFPGVDFNKVVRMCLVHDLGEVYDGDVSATIEANREEKLKREENAVNKLCALLPEKIRTRLLPIWWEYNKGETPEAKLAKSLDKMETIIQHNQGKNPPDFDYAFNLQYGKEYSQLDPVMTALRQIVDRETMNRDREQRRKNSPKK